MTLYRWAIAVASWTLFASMVGAPGYLAGKWRARDPFRASPEEVEDWVTARDPGTVELYLVDGGLRLVDWQRDGWVS